MSQSTFQLIDSGNFQKLEQIGPFRFVRPSPQAVWRPRLAKADCGKVLMLSLQETLVVMESGQLKIRK